MRTYVQKQRPTQQMKSINSTTYGRTFFGQNHAEHSIMHLQRTIGNQAALRLLQANTEELETDSATTTLSRFAYDFSRIPLHAEPHAKIQRNPTISTPGDIYEHEADRVAEQVMRMPEPKMQPACACGGGCPKCRAEQLSLDHGLLQTSRVQPPVARETTAPPIVEEVLRSPGQPLDASTRTFFESRFGHNFSQVRVHTDVRAAESARAVSALAYTVGRDVVLAEGRYAPGSASGRRLLAHELTHVIQQGNAQPTEGGSARAYTSGTGVVNRAESDGAANCPDCRRNSRSPSLHKARAEEGVKPIQSVHSISPTHLSGEAEVQRQLDPNQLTCAALCAICVGTLIAPELILPEIACALCVRMCSAGRA